MGITAESAAFLAQAARDGVRFERTLTIGRQTTFVGPRRLRAALRAHGPPGAASRPLRFDDAPWTIDPFLRALGADQVTALDTSDYEGAELIHDLNEPVPDALHERFTLVLDGGSLEHIFNVPVAIENYMKLVEVGGHLIVLTTGNNLLGHGLYQFSPELFFRVLSPENGFAVERVVAMEGYVTFQRFLGATIPYERAGRWYEVADPAVVRERVQLQNSRPVFLVVQARRTSRVQMLVDPPYQSDYVAAWQAGEAVAGEQTLRDRVLRPFAAGSPLEAYARRFLTTERRMALVLDYLPRLLPFMSPFWFGRDRRTRSFRNRKAFRLVRGRLSRRRPPARSS
jgi:hypothetical protein